MRARSCVIGRSCQCSTGARIPSASGSSSLKTLAHLSILVSGAMFFGVFVLCSKDTSVVCIATTLVLIV